MKKQNTKLEVLKSLALGGILCSGVALAEFANSAGDPSMSNTTNMDNTGTSAGSTGSGAGTTGAGSVGTGTGMSDTSMDQHLHEERRIDRINNATGSSSVGTDTIGNGANTGATAGLGNGQWNKFTTTDNIRSVQNALSAQGLEVGSVDGRFGPQTRSALREYQQNNGLAVTGTINQETLDSLGIEYDAATNMEDTNTFAE